MRSNFGKSFTRHLVSQGTLRNQYTVSTHRKIKTTKGFPVQRGIARGGRCNVTAASGHCPVIKCSEAYFYEMWSSCCFSLSSNTRSRAAAVNKTMPMIEAVKPRLSGTRFHMWLKLKRAINVTPKSLPLIKNWFVCYIRLELGTSHPSRAQIKCV